MQTNKKKNIHCELFIIGAGMAGIAAAIFAAGRGIRTVQAGRTGETLYASGLFDLYGVSHGSNRELIDHPWVALERLRKRHPEHPYSRMSAEQIRTAMDALTGFMKESGQPYTGFSDKNVRLLTSMGTVKRSFRIPESMWAGVQALQKKRPCLIVDIQGLRGFSAIQIVETANVTWPGLTAATIDLPGENRLGPKYAEHIARGLQAEPALKELADAIRPLLGEAEVVGLPAVLGIQEPTRVCRDLETLLGRPVFEIPTMPPAVAGVRLKETFDIHLPRLGVQTYYHHIVHSIRRKTGGPFLLEVGRSTPEISVLADKVLLATGRFLGKGLTAERNGIREPLLNLPVSQPDDRSCWHRESFLDPKGHAINLAGLEVDNLFRPVDAAGRPVYDNLYAAGSILAHQDWIRTKSGTGLAVASAFGAVEAIQKHKEATS
jgi:glycerol-3-phosphate dehydrogenase subunit B